MFPLSCCYGATEPVDCYEAQEQAPRIAGWVLRQIGLLYRWEQQLRDSRAGPVQRQVFRASHHRMVMERLHRALNKLQPRYLPQSLMGQAIGYALNQWPVLERFLEHGEVEIDNNLVENAIRPTALGRKNWLFFGSEEAGACSAVIYTLIENCRMHGVEPYTYLKDVLEHLPTTTNRQVAQRRRSTGRRLASRNSSKPPEFPSAPSQPFILPALARSNRGSPLYRLRSCGVLGRRIYAPHFL